MDTPVRIIVETKDADAIRIMNANFGAKSYMDLDIATRSGIQVGKPMMSIFAMSVDVLPHLAQEVIVHILVDLAIAAGGRLVRKLSLEAGNGGDLLSDVVRISEDEGNVGSEATITVHSSNVDLLVSGEIYASHPEKSLEKTYDKVDKAYSDLREHMIASRSFRTRIVVIIDELDE